MFLGILTALLRFRYAKIWLNFYFKTLNLKDFYMGKISTVCYAGDLRNELTHLQSGSVINTDAPLDNKGKGEAFSPTDLLSTSLAACALTIMGIKANDIGINLTGVRAEVEKEMASEPRRVAKIIVDFYLSSSLDERNRRLLEAAAKACPVAKSLSSDLIQEFHFHYD